MQKTQELPKVYFATATISETPTPESGEAKVKEVAHADKVRLFAVHAKNEVFVNELHILFSRSFERNGKLFAFAKEEAEAMETLNAYCFEEMERFKKEAEIRKRMAIETKETAHRLTEKEQNKR